MEGLIQLWLIAPQAELEMEDTQKWGDELR